MSDETKIARLIEDMASHSVKEYPKEACGIILKSLEYVPIKNISPQPKSSFIVDPFAILDHEDNILGFFHSHPGQKDPIPSNKDLASTAFSEYVFIVGFSDKFYRYWQQDNEIKFERLDENNFKAIQIPS